MSAISRFFIDGLFAFVGMVIGAVAGYLGVSAYCDHIAMHHWIDALAPFGAVIGAAFLGVAGANLRGLIRRILKRKDSA